MLISQVQHIASALIQKLFWHLTSWICSKGLPEVLANCIYLLQASASSRAELWVRPNYILSLSSWTFSRLWTNMCRSSQFITMRWICFSRQCREHTIKVRMNNLFIYGVLVLWRNLVWPLRNETHNIPTHLNSFTPLLGWWLWPCELIKIAYLSSCIC